jgi:hypothetical protein
VAPFPPPSTIASVDLTPGRWNVPPCVTTRQNWQPLATARFDRAPCAGAEHVQFVIPPCESCRLAWKLLIGFHRVRLTAEFLGCIDVDQ